MKKKNKKKKNNNNKKKKKKKLLLNVATERIVCVNMKRICLRLL